MSAPPSIKPKPKPRSFRRGLDEFGTFSIEASANGGRNWEATIVGLDLKYVDTQLAKLKKAGAQIARPAQQ